MRAMFAVLENTYRELIRDKVLYIILFFGIALLVLSLLLSNLSLNEKVRLSINFGLSGVHLCMVVLSVFLGSTLIFREIDKKTILFVMSYPISRTQFLIGKFLGFLKLLFLVLIGLFILLLLIVYKSGWVFHVSLIIAILGIYLETILLLSITMAFSSIVRPVVAVGISIGFFLMGHGLNSFYEIMQKSSKVVLKNISEVLMWVVPNLEHVNWMNFVAYNEVIETQLMIKSIIYVLGWTLFFLTFAVIFLGEKILFNEVLIEYGVFVFFILGALFGSFANVLIYRLPQNKSVVSPHSACMKCSKAISWYDNIPIFSWFLLKGRCRNCQSPFSIRYALVEVIMAFLFAYSFYKFQFSFNLLEILILMFGLVVISFIDIDHFLIPDKISLPGIVIGIIGSILNPQRELMDSILGILMGGGFLWAVAYVYYMLKKEEGLGGGDIKLLAWIGAVCTWKSVPFVILFSSVFGSLVGFLLIMKNKGTMKTVIPFGPYIAASAIIYIFWGEEITNWYISIFLPNL